MSSNETSDRWTWPGKKPRSWWITNQNGIDVCPNAAIWMRDELRSKVRTTDKASQAHRSKQIHMSADNTITVNLQCEPKNDYCFLINWCLIIFVIRSWQNGPHQLKRVTGCEDVQHIHLKYRVASETTQRWELEQHWASTRRTRVLLWTSHSVPQVHLSHINHPVNAHKHQRNNGYSLLQLLYINRLTSSNVNLPNQWSYWQQLFINQSISRSVGRSGLHPFRSSVSSVLNHFGSQDRSDAATSVLCTVTSVLRCYSVAAIWHRTESVFIDSRGTVHRCQSQLLHIQFNLV